MTATAEHAANFTLTVSGGSSFCELTFDGRDDVMEHMCRAAEASPCTAFYLLFRGRVTVNGAMYEVRGPRVPTPLPRSECQGCAEHHHELVVFEGPGRISMNPGVTPLDLVVRTERLVEQSEPYICFRLVDSYRTRAVRAANALLDAAMDGPELDAADMVNQGRPWTDRRGVLIRLSLANNEFASAIRHFAARGRPR
jgi:hypothetical protein